MVPILMEAPKLGVSPSCGAGLEPPPIASRAHLALACTYEQCDYLAAPTRLLRSDHHVSPVSPMPNGSLTLTAPPALDVALSDMQVRLARMLLLMSSQAFLHLVLFFVLAMLPKLHNLSPAVLGLLCGLVVVVALITAFVYAAFEAITALLKYRLTSRLSANPQGEPFSAIFRHPSSLFRPPRLTTFVTH